MQGKKSAAAADFCVCARSLSSPGELYSTALAGVFHKVRQKNVDNVEKTVNNSKSCEAEFVNRKI